MNFAPLFLSLIALVLFPPAAARCAEAKKQQPAPSIPQIAATLEKGSLRAQQQALTVLGTRPGPAADRILLVQFERYRTGDLPPALWLELFDAAAKRDNPKLKALLAEREQKLAASHDPLSRYRECLEGGDATAGREIFTQKPEAGCVRCHRVGEEGGEIGPDLTALHQTTDRLYILESIVDPNAVIAPGFQNVLLTLKNGEAVSGVLRFESEEELIITSVVDGKQKKIPAAEVVEQTPLPSAMPPGFGLILSKHALRDLVEFIAQAK